MTTADDVRSILLVLRLRGSADTPTVVEALTTMGVAIQDTDVLLSRIEPAGLVQARVGTSTRWSLTAEGRAEGERLLAIELDEHEARGAVTDGYVRFLRLNGPLLRVCTDWQVRDATPGSLIVNDHSDADFDQSVISRLGSVHQAVIPVCEQLQGALPRLGHYAERLSRARSQVEAGDSAALDSSTSSYHHVWFELHEDLIATLGRDRSTEPLPDTSVWPPTR